MPQPENQQVLEQHKQAEPVFQQQQDIRQELTRLQTWDLAPGQTLEQARAAHAQVLIQRQQEDNVALMARAQVQLPQAQANAAAPGQPVQQQVPAQKTYKEKRMEARKTRQAKKHSPYADHVSYDIQRQLERQDTGKDNSVTPEVLQRAREAGVDRRMLRCFCKGYQKDKKGQPATAEEAQKMREDQDFLDAYLSGDVARRAPYLQKFAEELMKLNISADMYAPENVHKNAARLKQIADQMTYFENMQKDPVNAPFFQNMDPLQLDLLNAKLDTLAPICGMLTVSQMGAMAVNCDKATYYDERVYIQNSRDLRDGQMPVLRAQLEECRRRELEVAQRHADAMADQAEAELLRNNQVLKDESETNQKTEGLGFTAYTTGYSFEELGKYRTMIESHPEEYARHKEIIDRVYQGLHHAMDILGELNGRIMAYQQVSDSRHLRQDRPSRLLVSQALRKQEELMGQADMVRKQFAAMADSLRFYLLGTEISPPASLMLEREGLLAEAQRLYAQRQVEKTISGPGGTVEASNATLRRAREQGVIPGAATAMAIQALGLRNTSLPSAQADKLVRGTTYIGLPGDIALYFTTTEAANVDYAQVEKHMQKHAVKGSAAGFAAGGGVDQVNTALLSMFARYITSRESIAYLRYMTQALAGAEVFEADTGKMVSFLSQTLINSYGANFSAVHERQDSYRNGAAVRAVAVEACRTMLALPAMTHLSPEQRRQLPQPTQQLLAQYEQLLRTLTRMVLRPEAPFNPAPAAPDAPDTPAR